MIRGESVEIWYVQRDAVADEELERVRVEAEGILRAARVFMKQYAFSASARYRKDFGSIFNELQMYESENGIISDLTIIARGVYHMSNGKMGIKQKRTIDSLMGSLGMLPLQS